MMLEIGFLCGIALSLGISIGVYIERRRNTKEVTPSASHNRAITKLPSFMEVVKHTGVFTGSMTIVENAKYNSVKQCYEFISRQLSQ